MTGKPLTNIDGTGCKKGGPAGPGSHFSYPSSDVILNGLGSQPHQPRDDFVFLHISCCLRTHFGSRARSKVWPREHVYSSLRDLTFRKMCKGEAVQDGANLTNVANVMDVGSATECSDSAPEAAKRSLRSAPKALPTLAMAPSWGHEP